MSSLPPAGTRGFLLPVGFFVATVVQLLVATFATDLPQFAGKGFGARLAAYPVLMVLVPAAWFALRRMRRRVTGRERVPWTAFALVMAPFLVDVTGNTLDLYDTIAWWDDANHFVNWFLLCMGIALLLPLSELAARWAVSLLVTGVGAMLALGWELGEWYTFIRHGTELGTAYEDTLADQALGTAGAALAGLLVVHLLCRHDRATSPPPRLQAERRQARRRHTAPAGRRS